MGSVREREREGERGRERGRDGSQDETRLGLDQFHDSSKVVLLLKILSLKLFARNKLIGPFDLFDNAFKGLL